LVTTVKSTTNVTISYSPVIISYIINTTIKTTSVCDGDAWCVGGGRGWLAGDTDGLASDG